MLKCIPIVLEPARFAVTGVGITYGIRADFYECVDAIDAPNFVPRGSLVSTWHKPDSADRYGRHYISATEARP